MLKDNGPLARAIHHGETSHLDARIVGAVVLVQDLTESKKVIEQELQQRVAKLISLGVELEESVSD
jgi:DNA-binding transcriptional regulator YbjK